LLTIRSTLKGADPLETLDFIEFSSCPQMHDWHVSFGVVAIPLAAHE
jgi:hypothetical protein